MNVQLCHNFKINRLCYAALPLLCTILSGFALGQSGQESHPAGSLSVSGPNDTSCYMTAPRMPEGKNPVLSISYFDKRIGIFPVLDLWKNGRLVWFKNYRECSQTPTHGNLDYYCAIIRRWPDIPKEEFFHLQGPYYQTFVSTETVQLLLNSIDNFAPVVVKYQSYPGAEGMGMTFLHVSTDSRCISLLSNAEPFESFSGQFNADRMKHQGLSTTPQPTGAGEVGYEQFRTTWDYITNSVLNLIPEDSAAIENLGVINTYWRDHEGLKQQLESDPLFSSVLSSILRDANSPSGFQNVCRCFETSPGERRIEEASRVRVMDSPTSFVTYTPETSSNECPLATFVYNDYGHDSREIPLVIVWRDGKIIWHNNTKRYTDFFDYNGYSEMSIRRSASRYRENVNLSGDYDDVLCWMKGPYCEARIPPAKIQAMLATLQNQSVFTGAVRRSCPWIAESPTEEIQIHSGTLNTMLKSQHDPFSASDGMFMTAAGKMVPLNGKPPEELLALEPEDYQKFRQDWLAAKTALLELIPPDDFPRRELGLVSFHQRACSFENSTPPSPTPAPQQTRP